LSENIELTLAGSRYNTIEEERSDLYSEYFYLPIPGDNSDKQFLKSAQENVNNRLDLTNYEFNPVLKIVSGDHLFSAGLNIRLTNFENKVIESFSESSDSLISDLPINRIIDEKSKLNSYSVFLQDEFKLFEKLFVNAGIRTNYYEYNKEFLLSPRTTIVYVPFAKHSFNLSWGYHYQSPYSAELRNKVLSSG